MNNIELNIFKQMFLKRKEEIKKSLNSAGSEIDVDGDEVDEASAGVLGSVTASLSKRQLKELENINKALIRIEDGTFGECEECGCDIGEKRLKAKPDALTCIKCAERLESIARQFAI